MFKFLEKSLRFIKKRIFSPGLRPVAHNHVLTRLGSEYGGWTFVESPKLARSAIVCCGVGEDASFDIELATKFNCKILLVDPTPKAIEHFKSIQMAFGKPAAIPYQNGGRQPIEAYELSTIRLHDIELIEKALWIAETVLKFYMPANPDHVSHSIVNFQNNYKQDTEYIEVDS